LGAESSANKENEEWIQSKNGLLPFTMRHHLPKGGIHGIGLNVKGTQRGINLRNVEMAKRASLVPDKSVGFSQHCKKGESAAFLKRPIYPISLCQFYGQIPFIL
jgi:hypothetical protein